MQLIQNIVLALEEKKASLINYFIAFISIILIRNILELTLFEQPLSGVRLIHYSLFYVVILLGLSLIMHIATKESYVKIFKVFTPFFILMIFPVILDKLINLKSDMYMLGYLPPYDHSNLWAQYFSFANHRTSFGATTGVRIEVIVTLVLISFYLKVKKVSFLKSLITVIASYSFIFGLFTVLIFLTQLSKITNLSYKLSNPLLINFFTIIVIALTTIIIYQAKPKIFKAIVGQLQIHRAIHFLVLITFGLWLSLWSGHNPHSLMDIFKPINLYIAGFFVYLSAVNLNKLADNNSPDSLPSTTVIPARDHLNIAIGLGALGLIISSAVNFTSFMILAVFIALVWFYSIEPFRLKSYPILAKFIYSLSCVTIVMLGFSALSSNIYSFPASVGYILLFSCLAMNFIDLGRTKENANNNIKTLPVVLGDKWAKRLIGVFFIATYLAAYYFFAPNLLILGLLIIFGLIQYFLINKGTYEEKYVFTTYLFSFITLWFLFAYFFK